MISCRSPRTTQRLHQLGYVLCFLHISLVLHEAPCLISKPAAPALALSGLGDRLPSGLGATDASAAGDLIQRAETIASKSKRQGMRSRCHDRTVAHNALHKERLSAVKRRNAALRALWPLPPRPLGPSVAPWLRDPRAVARRYLR